MVGSRFWAAKERFIFGGLKRFGAGMVESTESGQLEIE
jgi:hypothetical protein